MGEPRSCPSPQLDISAHFLIGGRGEGPDQGKATSLLF